MRASESGRSRRRRPLLAGGGGGDGVSQVDAKVAASMASAAKDFFTWDRLLFIILTLQLIGFTAFIFRADSHVMRRVIE